MPNNLSSPCRCGKSLHDSSAVHFEAIVPMYKSVDHVPDLVDYLDNLSEKIVGRLFVTFVVDGNVDSTTEALANYTKGDRTWDSKIIQFSRNFGVGPALIAAFENSNSCASVAFGADLQEPLDLLLEFQKLLTNPDLNLVLGVRRSRNDPTVSKLFSKIYWRLYSRFISPNTPKGGFDVCGLSENAKSVLARMHEKNTNITAQIDWLGFSRQYIEFDRKPRSIGKSTWSFGKKLRLFFDSFYGFTDLPIRIMQLTSGLGIIFFSLLGLLTGVSWTLGLIQIPGYTTIIFLQLFTANLVILCISILAGYVTRTFDNTKNRPRYVVERIIE
jgi:glycosyltransferase involved in cell wall biosynthesis